MGCGCEERKKRIKHVVGAVKGSAAALSERGLLALKKMIEANPDKRKFIHPELLKKIRKE